MKKYRIWYRENRRSESGPWTGYADTPEAAGKKMVEWFQDCGSCGEIEITRTQLVEQPSAKPYDPEAHLRGLRWLDGVQP
jgi:hypothetical protein